jgi:hypothetical protein
MELNINENIKKFLSVIIFLLLPLLILAIGVILSVKSVGYFLLGVVWFGLGIIFYGALQSYKS